MRSSILLFQIPKSFVNTVPPLIRLRLDVRSFTTQPQKLTTPTKPCCAKKEEELATKDQPKFFSKEFWSDSHSWRRASTNTFRCLVGCTLGDLSALFYLQEHYPTLGTSIIMPIAMVSGISTSILIETLTLRF